LIKHKTRHETMWSNSFIFRICKPNREKYMESAHILKQIPAHMQMSLQLKEHLCFRSCCTCLIDRKHAPKKRAVRGNNEEDYKTPSHTQQMVWRLSSVILSSHFVWAHRGVWIHKAGLTPHHSTRRPGSSHWGGRSSGSSHWGGKSSGSSHWGRKSSESMKCAEFEQLLLTLWL